jgi:hypothetical protein
MENQLTRGAKKRLMYIENKQGEIDGANARIGWVTFSKSGKSVFYRGRELGKIKGGGISANFKDVETYEQYWVSGVKQEGSNTHPAESVSVVIDDDAKEEYRSIRSK